MMVVTMELRGILMLVCLVLIGLVFVAMVAVTWRHYRNGGTGAPNFHSSLLVEICWVLAPLLIVMALIWPTARMVLLQ